MKTTTLEQPTTNNLKHTINLHNAKIEISLADDCKNGHNDFHITATFWEKGKPHTDRYFTNAGSCHDEILRVKPSLKIFADLHGCDAKGAPMYAQANGYYHLKNSSKETVLSYLRITSEEYDVLSIAEDLKYFTYILDNVLHIPERWQKEAIQAIKLLEGMTGLKFEDDSKRGQFTPLTEDVANDIEFKIKSGYYAAEEIASREAKKLADAKAKTIAKLTEERDGKIKKATDEYDVKVTILNAGLPIDNLIYYNHTNKTVFNWKDYDKKITSDQFNAFISSVDYSKLPAGITFEFGEKKN